MKESAPSCSTPRNLQTFQGEWTLLRNVTVHAEKPEK